MQEYDELGLEMNTFLNAVILVKYLTKPLGYTKKTSLFTV